MLARRKSPILIILVGAFLLRLVAIKQSLWLDEAIGAYAVKNFTYNALLVDFMKFDFHPPLYYILLKFWTGLFGYSEVILRLPSIIFGLGTIWITYLIAKFIQKKREDILFPIISATLLAISQFDVDYSQEARMYSMAAFFATLSIYSLLKILKEEKEQNYSVYLIFSLAITALIFSDYMPVFLFPVYIIAPIIFKKGKMWWFRYLSTFVIPILLGILWLPTLFVQISSGKDLMESLPAWRNIIGGSNIKQLILVWNKFVFGRISFPNKPLYYLLVVVASIPILGSFTTLVKKRAREIDLIALWLIVPLGLGFLASFMFPAFNYFRYVYLIPAFYLLISWGVVNLKSKGVKNIILGALIMFNVFSFVIYAFDAKQQRETWRQATKYIEGSAKELDVVIFAYPRQFTPFRWYASGTTESYGVTDAVASDANKTKQKTQKAIMGKSGVYYFEYLADLSDPEGVILNVLEKNDFSVTEIHNFQGVGQVYYYQK